MEPYSIFISRIIRIDCNDPGKISEALIHCYLNVQYIYILYSQSDLDETDSVFQPIPIS